MNKIITEINKLIETDINNKEALGLFKQIFSNLPEIQLEAINYFINTMPDFNDITLIIIKGHLLLEQQIRNIFKSNFNNPNAIERTRLNISQIIDITEASYEYSESKKYLWESIRLLNNIRNDVAHNIESDGLKNKISNLIEKSRNILIIDINKNENLESKLKSCILGLGAHLISLSTNAQESRKEREKIQNINKLYQNDYAKFDNTLNEILFEDDIRNDEELKIKEEHDLFKKSLNNTYFKLINLVDITNQEYIDLTYGALLAGKERAELLEGEDLIKSFEILKIQHSDLINELNNNFKNEYDNLIIETTNELKDTLKKELENTLK